MRFKHAVNPQSWKSFEKDRWHSACTSNPSCLSLNVLLLGCPGAPARLDSIGIHAEIALLHAHRDLGMAEAPGPVLMEDVGFRASAGSTGLVPRTSQGVTGAHSDTSAQCLAPRGAQWLQCYHHSGSWLIRSPQQHPGMGGPAGCLSNTHSIRPLQPCPQDLGSRMVGRCWRPPRGS